jgi:hypothetical protein
MSKQEENEPPEEVLDEEGDVDKAFKRGIIQAWGRVDETETALYRDAAIDPDVRLSDGERVQIYAMAVKQFLRRVEPLLRSPNIQGNKQYYNGEEDNPIATFELVPPETGGYPFQLVQQDHSQSELRRMIGLPKSADVPQPKTVRIVGLKDVIEREPVARYQWEVCVRKEGAPPNWEFVYPQNTRAFPKSVYVNAVRRTVQFLQDAGIGLETDVAGTEIIRDFDASNGEPESRFTVGDYESNPDI